MSVISGLHDMAIKGDDGTASHTKFFSFLAQATIIILAYVVAFTGAHIDLTVWVCLGGLTANRSLTAIIAQVWGKAQA